MIKTALITILISSSAFAQMQPSQSSNPSAGFGTATTPTDSSPGSLPTNTLPQNNTTTTQDDRGNAFPQQQMEERNNFAGGALGGAAPGTTIPDTPGAVTPNSSFPGSTSPGVAPTTPNLPGSGIGTGTTTPGSTAPTTP